MKKPDTILDEIHATRRKIEEQTKNMTSSERAEYFNKTGATAARKYGFRRVAKPKKNSTERLTHSVPSCAILLYLSASPWGSSSGKKRK